MKDQRGMTQIKEWTHWHVQTHTHTHTHVVWQGRARGEVRMVTASTLVSLSVPPEDRDAEPSDRNDPLSSATSTLVTQNTLLSSWMHRKQLSSSILFSPIRNLAKLQQFQHVMVKKKKMQTLIFNIIKKFPLIFMLVEIWAVCERNMHMGHTALRVDAKKCWKPTRKSPWHQFIVTEAALIACSIAAVNERSCVLNQWVAVLEFSDT